MTITSAADYHAWINANNTQPVVLIVAQHSAGTVYFGNLPFISGNGDTPANTVFDDYLIDEITIIDRLDRGQNGDLLLVNDGSLDNWIDLKWVGYDLTVYYGDQSWSFDEIRTYGQVLAGINAGISSPASDRLSFKFGDRREKLRQIVGSESSPRIFGRVLNITPHLVDAATLRYKCNNILTSMDRIRDNGVLLTRYTDYTLYPDAGEFILLSPPSGAITMDCRVSARTLPHIVAGLCQMAGVPFDAANLTAWPELNPHRTGVAATLFGVTTTENRQATIGIYLDREETIESALNDLCASLGGAYRITGAGVLQLFRIEAPAATVSLTLTADDIEERGMRMDTIEQPIKKLTFGWNKRWTVQDIDGLAGSVSVTGREFYSEEYTEIEVSQSLDGYPEAREKVVDTLITGTTAAAAAEANRRLALRQVPRKQYRLTCYLTAYQAIIGETIRVIYPGFGFENGKNVRVIGIRRQLDERRMELTLWE